MNNQFKQLAVAFLAYAAQREISADRLAALSNIDIKCLNENVIQSVTQQQINDLFLNAVQLSGDFYFGLHFGESLQLTALGIVGEIIKNSTTVGEALKVASSLAPLMTNWFILESNFKNDSVLIDFIPQEENWQANPAALQILDLLMVFVVHEIDGLTFRKNSPKTVHYSGVIREISEYKRVFRCSEIIPDQINRLTFSSSFWNDPLISANFDLQKHLIAQNYSFVKILSPTSSLEDKVYKHLVINSFLGTLSLEQVALNFNLSSRTLQRKLYGEGTSFQSITDKVRKMLAIKYLSSGIYPLKEISYMLGYNELSAFSRTFKRWTGLTPALYRLSINA
ncbi:MAG: AraC family transcriptional regulator ligand-binding domain-containing protein [Ginsengibacter sp.]